MLVGFFDSGVGGLSVLQEVTRRVPHVSTVYLADTAHFPYGTKSENEIRTIATQAVERLLPYKPEIIVVACNTASTSALDHLRQQYPQVTFIGLVPAIKPAVAMSQTKKIAVLATTRTLASPAYHQLKLTHAAGVTVIDQACPGWVELVEAGHLDDAEAEQAVRDVVEPLARQNVDAYVLGCTHYPFLRSLIQHFGGNTAVVLDSGEAIARQLQRLQTPSANVDQPRSEIFLTSGDLQTFVQRASRLLGRTVTV